MAHKSRTPKSHGLGGRSRRHRAEGAPDLIPHDFTSRPLDAGKDGEAGGGFNFRAHLARQAAWSEKTFGPGSRAKGVVDHIRKELQEIEAAPASRAVDLPSPNDEDLQPFGWAPGNYSAFCAQCRTAHDFTDKRSSRCRPCAALFWLEATQGQASSGDGEVARDRLESAIALRDEKWWSQNIALYNALRRVWVALGGTEGSSSGGTDLGEGDAHGK